MPTAAAIQEKAYQRRWAILVVLCTSLLVIVLDNSILNVAIPTLIRDLDASNSQVQWMVDSYTLVFAGLLLTMGALGDRYGRRGALQAGYVLFGLGSLASAFAGSADQLIATRAFMGIGGALDHAGDAVDHHQRLPAAGAGSRDRRVGRHRRHRGGDRSAHRRLPAGALLLGLDLPGEPAHRRVRPHRRLHPHPHEQGPERTEARPRGRGPLDRRPDLDRLRAHRGAERRVDLARARSASSGSVSWSSPSSCGGSAAATTRCST